MFDNFLHSGSVFGLVALLYASIVGFETFNVKRRGPHVGPLIAHSPLGSLFVFFAHTGSLWMAVYVGSFDGWISGLVSWLGLQVIGAIGTIVLRVQGPLLGLHILLGIPSLIIGYTLTVSNHPWL
jgi:hypothetical protein